MSDKQETIADIVAEMRGMGNYQHYSGDHAHALADRLEAAHRRELAEKDAEIAKFRREIDLCRGTGAASKARDLIEEMHRIHRLCSETDGDNWKQKIREISCKASWY